MSNRFLIDKITNSIEASKDGKSHLTEVVAVSAQEIKGVHKKDGWLFNWKLFRSLKHLTGKEHLPGFAYGPLSSPFL